jgi:anti-anti-sigma factor
LGTAANNRADRKEPAVSVTFEQDEAGVVCHLTGNLEHLTVVDFRESVAHLCDAKKLIFELSAVPFVDSAGLGALIGAVRRTRELGGEAVVCAARPSVQRVLEMVGLHRVVHVFGSLREAQEYFSGRAVA